MLKWNINLLESAIVLQETPRYVSDIRDQPQALQALLDQSPGDAATQLLKRLPRFDRVIMTGMGASLFAQYPAFLALSASGVPVWWVETSELLGDAGGLLTNGSLLWITSQSGRSAEVVALLAERVESRPRSQHGRRMAVLGVTNDPASPLAVSADGVLELHCGEEHTVGTRSYVNSLAAHLLATAIALGQPLSASASLSDMPGCLDAYLAKWDEHIGAWEQTVHQRDLFSLGRGASLAAAMTGALVVKEAANVAMEGMSAAQFRHGPLELAGAHTGVILFPGTGQSVPLAARLGADLAALGAGVVTLAVWDAPGDGPRLPAARSAQTLPIAEVVPLQLLSVLLAERQGLEPGSFRHIAKVTTIL